MIPDQGLKVGQRVGSALGPYDSFLVDEKSVRRAGDCVGFEQIGGYRQLRRPAPIETQKIQTPAGILVVPTLEELLRIKAFLAYDKKEGKVVFEFEPRPAKPAAKKVAKKAAA